MFYLVSHNGKLDWCEDGNDRWCLLLEGVSILKQDRFKVLDMIDCAYKELDHGRTVCCEPRDPPAGWLSPSGEFFHCKPYQHDRLAAYVLGLDVFDMEQRGWIRVPGSFLDF
jgi:hypothetical protein